MKKLLFFIIFITLSVLVLIKHDQIYCFYRGLAAAEFSHLSDAGLHRLYAENENRLERLRTSYSKTDDASEQRILSEQMIYLQKVQANIRTIVKNRQYQKSLPLWERIPVLVMPLALAILLAWAVYYRFRGRYKNGLAAAFPAAEGEAISAEFDPRIVKGQTPKQEVLRILGEPDHRVIFTELEAWTYLYRVKKQPEPEPALPRPIKSLIIVFRGNIVFDFSQDILLFRRQPDHIY